jgi:hypothetical protein
LGTSSNYSGASEYLGIFRSGCTVTVSYGLAGLATMKVVLLSIAIEADHIIPSESSRCHELSPLKDLDLNFCTANPCTEMAFVE